MRRSQINRMTSQTMSINVVEMTNQEMDDLIARVTDALDNGLSLEPQDTRLILQILRQFASMQARLESDQTIKQRYLKLMGLVSSSESQHSLFKSPDGNKKKPPRTSKRRQHQKTDSLPPTVCTHQLEGVKKGQPCPECEKGRLYKTEPASFIRISAQAPLQAQKHIMEQLRCRLCGYITTAPLPEDVLQDGVRQQKYGYSARALMTIHKFFLGNPYYRQQNLQNLLGMPVSASTIFDQVRLLVDDGLPVFNYLKLPAANAQHFHIDDTGHRVLDQTSIEKPRRNAKGTRERSGVYTSALIATLADGHQVVLFQTNIGHAGQWIDEILATRDSTLAPPIVMSDALSSNRPQHVDCHISLCASHARRKFVDILQYYPEQAEYVIEQYALIWQHDTQARADQLSVKDRQLHHQQHSLPVMKELQAWCEAQQEDPQFEGNSALGRAISYFLKHFECLTTFCRVPGANIDNNLVEMVLKLVALGRKNAYFYKTLAGAKVGDVATSLIATCELNGVNVFDYLVALQQNRWSVSQHPERWLPWTYRDTLADIDTEAA